MKFSMKKIAAMACPLVLAAECIHGWAAGPTNTVRLISETGAEQVILAAKQEAEKLYAPCAIAVVDSSGVLVAFLKMDGVRDGSPELAINKAKTSALLQRPSEETEDNVDNGRFSFVTSGFTTLRGGMPLKVNGEVVGAVGIAGLNKDNDVLTAQTAAKALDPTSRPTTP